MPVLVLELRAMSVTSQESGDGAKCVSTWTVPGTSIERTSRVPPSDRKDGRYVSR